MKRCMKCQQCRDWEKQRAAYSAAISEATPTVRELRTMTLTAQREARMKVEILEASWNALQEDPDFICT